MADVPARCREALVDRRGALAELTVSQRVGAVRVRVAAAGNFKRRNGLQLRRNGCALLRTRLHSRGRGQIPPERVRVTPIGRSVLEEGIFSRRNALELWRTCLSSRRKRKRG